MMTTLLVGMLCVYLLSFSVMFLLISRRLQGGTMGMDAFAAGNLMLGTAYVLQLLGGSGQWSWPSMLNHALTLSALAAYCVGGARFFGRPAPLLLPLAGVLAGYGIVQVLVEAAWGATARHAMLAGTCALWLAGMVTVLVHGARRFARDLRVEMLLIAALIAGLCVLNLAKLDRLMDGGLAGLAADTSFQMVFYVYMCSLATILPPAIIWLVLRRLTDALRATAGRDPLTQLLNRRGLTEALGAHFRQPDAKARLLMVDVDHFKRINDTHGHHVGDAMLCGVADVLRMAVRKDDLICRLGGEEFVVICLQADDATALRVAERVRSQIEARAMLRQPGHEALRCTVTVGVSGRFDGEASLAQAMRHADAALYRGKKAGRNRVESAQA